MLIHGNNKVTIIDAKALTELYPKLPNAIINLLNFSIQIYQQHFKKRHISHGHPFLNLNVFLNVVLLKQKIIVGNLIYTIFPFGNSFYASEIFSALKIFRRKYVSKIAK